MVAVGGLSPSLTRAEWLATASNFP